MQRQLPSPARSTTAVKERQLSQDKEVANIQTHSADKGSVDQTNFLKNMLKYSFPA
jgi:hypothetical protein